MKKLLFLMCFFLICGVAYAGWKDEVVLVDKDGTKVNFNATGSVATTNEDLEKDDIDDALVMIDLVHHKVHEGDHYFYSDSATLASGVSMSYLLSTTGTSVHMTIIQTGSAITTAEIYEGTDLSGSGAIQTSYNNNRDSTNLSTLRIWDNAVGGTTYGTLLYKIVSGASAAQSRSPSTSERSNEIILKAKGKYLLRTTSSTADNLTNLQLEWYEE